MSFKFIIDGTVPNDIHKCDLIDPVHVKCRLTETTCGIWRTGKCDQLISYPDYIHKREKECYAQMEGHNHDS